jgi:hypothetical protein
MLVRYQLPNSIEGVYLIDNLLHRLGYIYSLLKTLTVLQQERYKKNVRCIIVYYFHYDIS